MAKGKRKVVPAERAAYEPRGERQTVELVALAPNPWNPNEQDALIQDRMVASLSRFGIVSEILVREVGPDKPEGFGRQKRAGLQIINGEHRWRELAKLGVTHSDVRNLGTVADGEARQLTVILNELKGRPNALKLAKLIAELDDIGLRGEIAAVFPYTTEELNVLHRMARFEAPPPEIAPVVRSAAPPSAVPFRIGPYRAQLPGQVGAGVVAAMDRLAEVLLTPDAVAAAAALVAVIDDAIPPQEES